MTHPHDDHDSTQLKPLISGYLDRHTPDNSAQAFEDLLTHSMAKQPEPLESKKSFALGVLAAALIMGIIGTVVTLIPHTRPAPWSTSPAVPQAMPAQLETYGETPTGWYFVPSTNLLCEVGISYSEAHQGESSSILRSEESDKEDFCALSQSISAHKYAGKRVRFLAWVKSEEVTHHAGLWMKIGGKKGDSLEFDNMSNRPIRGTRGWERYAVVLDVPAEAHTITYGALLAGDGKIFWDAAELEIVKDATPSTNMIKSTPHNTSFEE